MKVTKHPAYGSWKKMKQRCYDANDKDFSRYGGRGITVCEEWQNSSRAFLEWADASGYRPGLSVDRIDTDGNYCPENCRWVDRTTQNQNRRKQKNNSSGYIGVRKARKRWRAHISINKRRLYLGYFDTPLEAARVRDDVARETSPDFTLNDLPEQHIEMTIDYARVSA